MSLQRSPQAILAIWNDCAPGREAIYEQWYQSEHLRERLSVPGFRVGRRYEAVSAHRQFLTTYEVDRPEILTSADYLARLSNPTELTREVMADGFLNASRTICERRRVRGAARAATVLTVAVDSGTESAAIDELAQQYPVDAEVIHSEIWASVHPPVQGRSAEAALRGPDTTISVCLAIEFVREGPAMAAFQRARAALPGADVGVYRLLCTFRKEDLSCGS